MLVLGMMLLGLSYRYFERSQFDMMRRFVAQAADVTTQSYIGNDKSYVEESLISMAYSVVSRAIYADVFLTDISGAVVFHSDAGVEGVDKIPAGSRVGAEIISLAVNLGGYEQTGTLGGYFERPRFVVAVPVLADGEAFGVVFASSSADDFLKFVVELTKMFLLSALVVLALVTVVIYFIAARMADPLKNILDATHRFSQGDFSKRVPVSKYDEMGQLSMAFNNMASVLANNESSRRSFIANVSHELKTPMTTISGFVDGILDGTIPEEKRDQYLLIVSNECKRLSRLVRSMLDTARLEAGELEIRPTLFDISEVVRQTVFTFEQAVEEKKLEILGLEQDKIMILADIDLMHQVVYNLIDNAVKFADAGGYVSVSYSVDKAGTHVTIRNSGEGIPKEEAARLFERFYKSDRSRSANKDGVGLGLHIVRSIIQYHKGEITVKSVPGEYTEFEFVLPADRN